MSNKDVLLEVIEVFSEVMDMDSAGVSAATTPEDVESWDSLSHVRLVMSLERAFSVRMTNAEIGALQSVGDIANLLSAKAPA